MSPRLWPLMITLLLSCLFLSLSGADPAHSSDLPPRLLIGYWHNWIGSPLSLRITEIPEEFDLINIAFAVPNVIYGSQMQFSPDPGIYPYIDEFVSDIDLLQSQGKKVQISIGGATGPIQLHDQEDIDDFVTSMSAIITMYGFDGIDIDLEGQSLFLEAGDSDYRYPTSPLIVNFITATNQLLETMPEDFTLTMAPETAYVQGGYQTYGGIWGAYLPVIHALRDRLTLLHVQHYNTGSMFGGDGVVYYPATADFHVAMSDMLLAGFSVDHWGANIWFEPLRPDQILIGLPAAPEAAGSGYTEPAIVHDALNYLILGQSFGGAYLLANPAGYDELRGLMTWSANWDVDYDRLFSWTHRQYLDNLFLSDANDREAYIAAISASLTNWPNPFTETTIQYRLPGDAEVDLSLFDIAGRQVTTLVHAHQDAGVYNIPFSGRSLSQSIYWYRLRAGDTIVTKQLNPIR